MSFEKSGPRIYKTMQLDGEMHRMAKEDDVISVLSPFEGQGFGWNAAIGQLSKVGGSDKYEVFSTPWCHARHLNTKRCALDHQLIFKLYGIIPPRCMSCWKTCMALKNFDELMTWQKVQTDEMNIPAKCGIELRDYTPRHYGAYHYAGSLDEGVEMYEFVHGLAKKYLSEETANSVILKRACTEFEMEKGPSTHWHLGEEEERILNLIETYVHYPTGLVGQNKALAHPYVKLKWLLWAHHNGDFSYLPYNGNKKLFPDVVTYHDKDLQSMKHDMALLSTEARHGISQQIIQEYLLGTSKFAKDHDITMDKFATVFGIPTKPACGVLDFGGFNDVDPNTTGEADIEPGE